MSYHHTEAECAHDNHPDVYGGVLDKLDTDPFEEKDVLAKPWVTAQLVKELVVAEGEQVGGHLPHHLLPGGGDAPEGEQEDSGGGEDRQLQPAFQLKQPAVRGDEKLEKLDQDKDDEKGGEGNEKKIVDGVQVG